MNGGWQAWVAAGLPVSYETPAPSGDVPPLVPAPRPDRLATLDELLEKHDSPDWHVLDLRSDGEYEGTEDHGNKRMGHIPGAAHLEWSRLLHNSADTEALRSFRSAEEMSAALADAGINPDQTVVTHCQAAVRATFGAFALELLGYATPRVYDGSMAEWANRDDTPLE